MPRADQIGPSGCSERERGMAHREKAGAVAVDPHHGQVVQHVDGQQLDVANREFLRVAHFPPGCGFFLP